jgi:urease accessory protein
MQLPRATEVEMPGAWPGPAADDLVLDFDSRYRRRLRLVTAGGEAVLLDLAQAVALPDGAALRLGDGRLLRVVAKPEPLIEVRASSAEHLARLAWHLGNRHLAVEVHGETLRLRPDHVIAAMLDGLGAEVRPVHAPFQPERGAYDDAHHA